MVSQHLNQAEHNQKFSEYIKYEFPDWALVGLFYGALHLLDAFLLKAYNVKYEGHKERFKMMSMTKELKPIAPDYQALYDYSRNARYDMVKFKPEDVSYAQEKFYAPIKAHLSKFLVEKKEKKKS